MPRYLLTQMMPHGRRQDRMPVFQRELAVRSTNATPLRLIKSGRSGYSPLAIPKEFELWEYRFWAMSTVNSKLLVTECRCCQNLGSSNTTQRRQHFKLNRCSSKLIEAYKLLLKDKRCIICNAKTIKATWGVPLCGDACIEAFCEVESQPMALKQALDLIPENF